MQNDPIKNLEEKIAHLTRAVDDLSDIVARQEGEIATLSRRMSMLMEREAGREADNGGSVVLSDQKPPHW
ncbi:SlyX family protein [Profundibacter amoris]|uniref:SlyX protein n=1 Tax=Profundibacter amoris TaxID=2171755 RepID=A0A347UIR8_9RHOB|nr:SlyX family protein [Profundibacter amoris]AXX98746.1 SlyX protein [Profundibacter amoris]